MGVWIPLLAFGVGACVGAGGMLARAHSAAGSSPLARILASLDAAYFRRDINTGEEECSVKLRRMIGLGENATRLSSVLSAFPEPQAQSLRKAMEEAARSTSPVLLTLPLDEGRRQIESTITCMRDARGVATQIIAWFRDTSAQEKQQQRIAKENEQLKRDMKQFSTILNVLPTPVWLRGPDLAIRYCNLSYSEAVEESPDHRGEQETLELHPHARALAQEALEAGTPRAERRHVIVGGERKLYQFTEIPLPQGGGVMVGIAQDVTELEAASEELQRHINAQSELLESVTSAMAVFGADQRLKFFNYAFVRLWGFDERWLNTQPPYGEVLEALREKRRLPEQANFPQFKQRHLKLFTDLIEPREEIFHLPDGRTLRVLAIPHALGGILFAYEDVTDRLALERSYNTLIAVQRATLDNLHEGVVVFGEDGRLRLYNPKFLQLWKLENAALSPQTHIADLIEKTRMLHHAPHWQSYKQDFIQQLLAREVKFKRIERTDGSVIDSVSVPLPDGATLINFTDVTDSTVVERSLRERNEALTQADRLKTEFLANVSYELRSPLTSISGFSEMLTQEYFGSLMPRQREYIGNIHQASQHLMHLIDDILDIASIEAGYMKLNITEFDIFAMLQSVAALLQERIREHTLQFTLECPRRIGKLLADESRMKQVLFNLLSNAVKYSGDGGKVTLTASVIRHEDKAKEEIVFTVEDEGAGIAPEEQSAVFGKFYKGSAGGRRSGAGLGLSMTKSFVEMHGGRVTLSSQPGKGTKVECCVPRRNSYLLLEKSMNEKVSS